MTIFQIIGGVLLIAVSLILIVTVTMQEPKGNGLGAVSGANDAPSFYDRNKGRTMDATLSRISKYAGFAMFIIALGVLAANLYL